MLAKLNPLYHTVELVRDAVLYGFGWADLFSVVYLVGFALVLWRVAIIAMTRKLID